MQKNPACLPNLHEQTHHSLQPGLLFWAIFASLLYILGMLWLSNTPARAPFSLDSAAPSYANPSATSRPAIISPLLPKLSLDMPLPGEDQRSSPSSPPADNTAAESPATSPEPPDSSAARMLVTPSPASAARHMADLVMADRIDDALAFQQRHFADEDEQQVSSLTLRNLVTARSPYASHWLAVAPGLDAAQQRYWGARMASMQGKHRDVVRTLENQLARWAAQPAQHQQELSLLAASLLAEGRMQQAHTAFQSLAGMRDARGSWILGLAITLQQQGNTAGATALYKRALSAPDLPDDSKQYARAQLTALGS